MDDDLTKRLRDEDFTIAPRMEAADTIDALRGRVKVLEGALELACDCADELQRPDSRMCCDGRECGCYGATHHDNARHYLQEARAALKDADT